LIDSKKAQSVIKNKAETGVVRTKRSGTARDVEDADYEFIVEKYFCNGEYQETEKPSIHYRKKSPHTIPIRGDNFD